MFIIVNSNNNIINNMSYSCYLVYFLLEIMKILFLIKELWKRGCLDYKFEGSLRNYRGIMKLYYKRWVIKVMVIKLNVFLKEI